MIQPTFTPEAIEYRNQKADSKWKRLRIMRKVWTWTEGFFSGFAHGYTFRIEETQKDMADMHLDLAAHRRDAVESRLKASKLESEVFELKFEITNEKSAHRATKERMNKMMMALNMALSGVKPGSTLMNRMKSALAGNPAETMEKYDIMVKDVRAALEYYSHPDHYEATMRITGLRPPGVLVEKGEKARKALEELNGVYGSN